jgi:hypothetical protein
MKKSILLREAEEQIVEYLYNMAIPDQVEILRMNFGVDVEDNDDGVVWEGSLITDNQFDQYVIEIIENMSSDTILDLWGDYVGYECEFDGENIVWEE